MSYLGKTNSPFPTRQSLKEMLGGSWWWIPENGKVRLDVKCLKETGLEGVPDLAPTCVPCLGATAAEFTSSRPLGHRAVERLLGQCTAVP